MFFSVEEYPHIQVKRQGLMPFPRVGRSGSGHLISRAALQEMIKRRGPESGANGMWFGPRLGRVQKRTPNARRDSQNEGEDV